MPIQTERPSTPQVMMTDTLMMPMRSVETLAYQTTMTMTATMMEYLMQLLMVLQMKDVRMELQ